MPEILSSAETLPVLQTVEEFERRERQHHTEGNYEFVLGRIIKKESVKQEEAYLYVFLARRFFCTAAFRRGDVLMPKTDSYVDKVRKRIPDLTYFSAEQLQSIRAGIQVSTAFPIEILSDSETDQPERRPGVLEKIQDYFDGGAQLVWYIAPKRQKIYVYTSPDESKATKATI